MVISTEELVEIRAFVFSHYDRIPTGTVVFVKDKKTIGNARLDENGIATLKISKSKLGVGNHSIMAHYAGCKEFGASISDTTVKIIV